jgi:hypothetical protein
VVQLFTRAEAADGVGFRPLYSSERDEDGRRVLVLATLPRLPPEVRLVCADRGNLRLNGALRCTPAVNQLERERTVIDADGVLETESGSCRV